jgi:hypothetical protein
VFVSATGMYNKIEKRNNHPATVNSFYITSKLENHCSIKRITANNEA